MSELIWNENPEPPQPLMVVAFKGLFDAAESASLRKINEESSVGV